MSSNFDQIPLLIFNFDQIPLLIFNFDKIPLDLLIFFKVTNVDTVLKYQMNAMAMYYVSFKHVYLGDEQANRRSMRWRIANAGRIGTPVSMATDSSRRVIMGKPCQHSSPYISIRSSPFLQVTTTTIISRMSSNSDQILSQTAELAALECFEKAP